MHCISEYSVYFQIYFSDIPEYQIQRLFSKSEEVRHRAIASSENVRGGRGGGRGGGGGGSILKLR